MDGLVAWSTGERPFHCSCSQGAAALPTSRPELKHGAVNSTKRKTPSPGGGWALFYAFTHGAGQSRRQRTVIGETGGATEMDSPHNYMAPSRRAFKPCWAHAEGSLGLNFGNVAAMAIEAGSLRRNGKIGRSVPTL